MNCNLINTESSFIIISEIGANLETEDSICIELVGGEESTINENNKLPFFTYTRKYGLEFKGQDINRREIS
jgi:hypothetical protein